MGHSGRAAVGSSVGLDIGGAVARDDAFPAPSLAIDRVAAGTSTLPGMGELPLVDPKPLSVERKYAQKWLFPD